MSEGRARFALALLLAVGTHAAAHEDCASVHGDGWVVRRSFVEGWWPLDVELPTGPYSPPMESEAIDRVNKARGERSRPDLELLSAGAVSITYTDTCLHLVDETECRRDAGTSRCLDLAVRIHALRVDLFNEGGNVLAVPRFNRFTDLTVVPEPLRVLHPQLGASHDRNFGGAATWGLATEVASALGLFGSSASRTGPVDLDLATTGRKSLDERFYDTRTQLRLATPRARSLLSRHSLEGDFSAEDEPLADGHVQRLLAYGGVGTRLRPDSDWLRTVALDTRYRWGHIDRHTSGDDEHRTENAGLGRAAIDARIRGALARLALWGEHASPTGRRSSYDRVAGFAGAAREFPVALNQTIGVELIAATGATWGGAPDDARFYAGNSERNFLYDGLDASTSVAFPSGPLMRNLGEAQGGVRVERGPVRGGTSFWNTSLTVSVPIPQLSRPLIPDVEVVPPLTLKTLLKKQVSTSGPSFLASTLQNQGRSEAEATAEAESVFRHITPVVEFLADQANLYALKPLLMVDASQMTRNGSDVRLGVGGGLQLTIVVARLEVGYVGSVLRQRGDDAGNAVFRLTFQNLF